jgi:hypothetical protein
VRRLFALLLALGVPVLALGCAGSFEEARGPSIRLGASPELSARCDSLDNRHRDWGAVAKGSAVVAGGVGAVAAIPDVDKTARIAVAGTGLGFAALAAFSVFESEGAATSWAAECAK